MHQVTYRNVFVQRSQQVILIGGGVDVALAEEQGRYPDWLVLG